MDTESTESEPADEDLLRRLSSDPAAFEVFYRRHVDRVIGFAARRVTDPADAADLVAATYRIVDMTPAGQPTTGYLVTVKPHKTTSIVIDYGKRTWSRTIYPFGSSSDARRPGPEPATPLQLAAQLRAKVKAGQVTLVGWATVDGQRAIHLREHMTHGQVNLWVDPDSYLPIREIDTAPGVAQTSDQAIRDDYRWLPATPANLRLLTPAGAIPPGFTQAG